MENGEYGTNQMSSYPRFWISMQEDNILRFFLESDEYICKSFGLVAFLKENTNEPLSHNTSVEYSQRPWPMDRVKITDFLRTIC